MTAADLQNALTLIHQKNSALDQLAEEILADLNIYFSGTKGFLTKRMVKMVKDRFERDGIDDAAFGYIVARLLRDFDALDDLYSVFDGVLAGTKRQRADLIVSDMQKVLNGTLLRTFTRERTPHDFVKIFEAKMIESGLETKQATALAKILWEEVQHKLGV